MMVRLRVGLPITLLLCVWCAARQSPVPDRSVATYGQEAARQFHDGQFSKAMRLYRKARGEAARLDIPQLEAQYVFNIGRIFYECSMFDSAQYFFSQSRSMFERENAGAEAAIAGVYESLARAYRGEHTAALEQFRMYSSMANPDDALTVAIAGMVLGLLQGDPAETLRYGDRADQILDRKHDDFSRGNIYYYRAMAVFMNNDRCRADALLDSSLYCFGRAPWRFRNWKSLLGKAVLAYCEHDTVLGRSYYLRAEKTAPGMIAFPHDSLVRTCPGRW